MVEPSAAAVAQSIVDKLGEDVRERIKHRIDFRWRLECTHHGLLRGDQRCYFTGYLVANFVTVLLTLDVVGVQSFLVSGIFLAFRQMQRAGHNIQALKMLFESPG